MRRLQDSVLVEDLHMICGQVHFSSPSAAPQFYQLLLGCYVIANPTSAACTVFSSDCGSVQFEPM